MYHNTDPHSSFFTSLNALRSVMEFNSKLSEVVCFERTNRVFEKKKMGQVDSQAGCGSNRGKVQTNSNTLKNTQQRSINRCSTYIHYLKGTACFLFKTEVFLIIS